MKHIDFALSPESTQVWDEIIAPKYAHHERILVEAAQNLSDRQWERLPRADCAIDVGCGFGDTTERLGKTCREAIGVDCSHLLIELAQERYGRVPNVHFEARDIAGYRPPRPADLVLSRFGLMFFERPVAALRAIRSWMAPGGALRTWVWASRAENPWLTLACDAVLGHVPPVSNDAPSCGPGPFSMAGAETTRALLLRAGFSNVRMQKEYSEVNLGTLDEAVAFQLDLGPAGEMMRHAEQSEHPGCKAARDGFAPFLTPNGVVLGSGAWWIEGTA